MTTDAPAAEELPPIDERRLRDALAEFATGVAIVCTRGEHGRYVGFTANSFNAVSLEPPLVTWSLALRSASLAAFERAAWYSINVLAADQAALARHFSRPHADRFDGVPHRPGQFGAPLIDGCVAWLECRHHARHPAGDHVLFIGEVVGVDRTHGRGLVFHHRRYGTTVPF